MSDVTGECFCGAVRYRIDGPLAPATRCHCSRCRKAFSGAGSAMARVASADFTWLAGEANVRIYAGQHGMGIGFCQTCGSTLVGTFKGAVMGITLGTLNGDPPVTIGQHIFVGSMARWDAIGDEAPQYAAWPD